MPRFNHNVTSKKRKKNVHLEIVNKDFLPTRNEFETDRVEKQLKNSHDSEIVFFNDNVRFSTQNTKLKFTNFISNAKQQYQINAISHFSSDISVLKSVEANMVNYNERMLSILSLYLKEDVQRIVGLMKSDIKGPLDLQEGLRVYWYYDLEDKKIKIVCIDPQHLVLPSKHNGISKDEMMIKTFYAVTNSKKHCISQYFIN